MLNDFGFAVPDGTHNLFAGTRRYAPTSVLRLLAAAPGDPIESKCWHDLESAVKLILDFGGRFDLPADTNALLSRWEALEVTYASMLELARSADYDQLIGRLLAYSV